MGNHSLPNAVQLDQQQLQTNNRKRKANPHEHPQPNEDYRPDALCAPGPSTTRLAIDVAAAAAAAAVSAATSSSHCYREDQSDPQPVAGGSTCSSPGAASSSSASSSTPASSASLTVSTSRPTKCVRISGLSHSAPTSPVEKHRRKHRRRDLATSTGRRRYARLYNKPSLAYNPFRFPFAGIGVYPPASLQQSQSLAHVASLSANVSPPSSSSSSSRTARVSHYPASEFCDGSSSSSSRIASAGLAGSRNCLHQSCAAFRFASMIDGVHLSSLSPQAQPLTSSASSSSSSSHQSKRTACFYVPPTLPPINRYTLQELDLDAITKNPQLRHDLLFDVGLQFRPTDSRRKRETTDMYWRAVRSELEAGCPCVSFDEARHMHRHFCACTSNFANSGTPPQNGARPAVPCEGQLPIKVPSRVGPLIEELREVIYAVIMPPPPPIRIRHGGSASHQPSSPTQPRRMTACDPTEVAWLREAFDAPLIEQQLRHGVFDPSKLLSAASNLLREHCASARDPIVDTILGIAKKCANKSEGTLVDALAGIRLCFDLLELMRLDLANHLLAQLRPHLLASAPTFEMSVFERRPNPIDSNTRAWISNTYGKLISSSDVHQSVGPLLPPPERMQALPSVQRVITTVLAALVDLVVFPPNPISAVLPPSPTTTPVTKGRQSYHVNVQAGYPETLYLDHSRLLMLTADAADITANTMFLALFRQLVFSESTKGGKRVSVQDDELCRLKSEINAIGPQRPGVCFCKEYNQSSSIEGQAYEANVTAWRDAMASVTLHLAHSVKKSVSDSSLSQVPMSQAYATGIAADSESDGNKKAAVAAAAVNDAFTPPDARLVDSVTSWCKSYMNANSDVAKVFRKKVATEMLKGLIPQFYTLWNAGAQRRSGDGSVSLAMAEVLSTDCEMAELEQSAEFHNGNLKTGLEPLAEEIRVLNERLARLAVLHLRVFLPLYVQGGFVQTFVA